jgi:hypothetical protein
MLRYDGGYDNPLTYEGVTDAERGGTISFESSYFN